MLSVTKTGFTISHIILDLPWITKENFPEPYNGAKRNREDPCIVCVEQQEATRWWTIKMNLAANQSLADAYIHPQ